MDDNGELEFPLAGTLFRVRESPGRPTHYKGSHDWGMGVRLGPRASGVESQYATSVQPAPTGRRKTLVREMLAFSQAPGQLGTGTPPLDSPANARVAMRHCEAGKFILVRLVGTTTRAPSAPRADIVQQAELRPKLPVLYSGY